MVFVSKTLPFQLVDLHIDQSGMYIILHALLRGKEYVFVGVYVPPPSPFQQGVLDDLIAKISFYANVLFIIWGDFNATHSHTLDRLQPPQTHNKAWAQVHNLTET